MEQILLNPILLRKITISKGVGQYLFPPVANVVPPGANVVPPAAKSVQTLHDFE